MNNYKYKYIILFCVFLIGGLKIQSQTLLNIVEFSPDYINVSASGGVYETTFTAMRGFDSYELESYIYNSSNFDNWNGDLTLQLIDVNSSGGVIQITAKVNKSSSERRSVIQIGRASFTVKQLAGKVFKIYNVSKGGIVYGTTGVSILLSGSETGVTYRLKLGDNIKASLTGTGSAISFNNIVEEGVYSIEAYLNGSMQMMNGTATVIKKVENSVIEVIPITEVKITAKKADGSYSTVNQLVNIAFYDGLGRVKQNVAVEASPSGKDLVGLAKYDEFGRSTKQYLSYTINGSGEYRYNDLSEQNAFYTSMYGSNHCAYTETKYDNTPLNKAIEQSAPGENYRMSSGHTVCTDNCVDSSNKIKKFIIGDQSITCTSKYTPGKLMVKKVIDRDDKESFEYIDANGKLIAKEAKISDTKSFFTYYVYDVFGLLRYIIPPKLEKDLVVGGIYSYANIKSLCYYNEYDKYHRLTKQYLPGVNRPLIKLYDKKGRAVLIQDGELKNEDKWIFTKYDIFNRAVMTGICIGTESSHIAALESQTVFYESRGGNIHGYTNNSYPNVSDVNSYLTISYYDDYNFPGAVNYSFNVSDALDVNKSNKVVGNITAEKVKVLGISSNLWLTTVSHYNDKNEIIQTVSDLYPSGTEVISTKYDFTGNIVENRVRQSVNGLTTVVRKYNSYDSHGRLKKVSQKIDGDAINNTVELAALEYDELGRVKNKKIHNKAETIGYTYDIGGRVTSVSCSKFRYNLGYDNTGGLPSAKSYYGGNISYMGWQNGTGANRAYVYNYDSLNQLKKADFLEKSGSSWVNSSKYDVEGLEYDDNGNIEGLVRKNGSGGILHNLSYAYSGNKLTSVNTNGSKSSGYLYNENGNMTFDGRKGINISYNILNLPEKISKGSQSISYIYSAGGEKLAMEFGSSLIYYRGGFIYSGNALDKIIHEEGSVIKTSGGYNYYYALKDHLGSTRVLCKGSGTSLITEQTTEYYPFGLAYSYNSVDKNAYLFSGKEYQNEVIDGTKLELYDFGSRFYDTEIGRWSAVDPALQLVSPYGYCMNNPVCCVDPDGEFIFTALSLIIPGAQALLPIAIGADIGAISGGIRGANTKGKTFWGGVWRGATVGAVGGALSMVGGGTFVANISWGIGEGAITGGLDAALWGNDIGQCMLYGASIGGVFALGQSTFQSVRNYKDYGMLGTNDGVFNRMVDNAISGGTVNATKAQTALDFWTDRFGGPAMKYSTGSTTTSALTGNIDIGQAKFLGGAGHVRRAIAHEHGHYFDDIVWQNDKVGGTPLGRWHDNSGYYRGDGILGYHHSIENSGKYHIPLSAIIDKNQLTSAYSKMAWANYALRSGKPGWLRYLYLIPKRF